MNLIGLAAVKAKSGMSRAWIYQAVEDGEFPKPVKIGAANRWLDTEVDNWVLDRVAARDGVARKTRVSEAELAPLLGCSVSWLQKDRSGARVIPFVKEGSAVRYDVDAATKAYAGRKKC